MSKLYKSWRYGFGTRFGSRIGMQQQKARRVRAGLSDTDNI